MSSLGTVPSREVCARVVALPSFRDATHVVLYVAVDGEVSAETLHAAAREAGKRVFLPRTTDGGLEFVEDDGSAYRPGRWGIPEPVSGRCLEGPGASVLFVVPGVAFDLRGRRLGRGLGAYDRALPRYPAAHRVGVAYEFQIVPALPSASWDVPMDAVITNARFIDARRARDGMKEMSQ